MMELISVIVPVYNVEQYLQKCIESITNQTYKNLEIILVDDGSTDRSGKICDKYAELDERIIVLHKENGGQATARNMALDIASGEYIGFVDSDDYIAEDMFEQLYKVCKCENCDMAVCGRYNVTDDRIWKSFTVEEPKVFDSFEGMRKLLTYDCLDSSPCDKLFQKNLFEGIRFPAGYICEDVAVVFRVIHKSKRIIHCAKPYYYYYARQGSTSKGKFSDKTMGIKIYHKEVYEFVQENYPQLKKEAEYFYFSRLSTVYKIMLRSNYKGKYKTEIYHDILKSLVTVIRNNYFSRREKMEAILIFFGIYGLLWKIKRNLWG